jgi:NADH-quinone oxidoreductase subunit G
MAKVTIDNTIFEFEGRPRLLQFCVDHDVELPHFCYHPAMSVPANCRQCLVKVGMPQLDRDTRLPVLDEAGKPVILYLPKLQTSCSTDVADGMVVLTHRTDDLVERSQKDNLEFLLINHPLDCPICDQAGNCPLQNQAYKYGPEGSRFEFRKARKPKAIPLGPQVMLDAERCINCTRCTRFTDEVSRSHQLTIIERGVKNYPMTPPGVVFDEPYSMNVIDICPVGALTSIDFRFKARAWEVSKTPSISTSNAKGSNCYYWVKDNLVLNVTSRANADVNDYWLADEDRLNYQQFNVDRPSGPGIRRGGATLSEAKWDEAYDRAGQLLRAATNGEVLFIGSAFASVEDNYLLARLAAHVGASAPVYIPHVTPGAGDGWLITDDKAPNAEGCERLGILPADAGLIRAKLGSGQVKVLYVLEEDPVGEGVIDAADLDGVDVILHHYHTTNQTLPLASVALPAAMLVETIGTFVNVDGHAQRVRPAKAVRGVNRSLTMEMRSSRLDEHGTPFDRWSVDANRVDCLPGWATLPAVASRLSLDLSFKGPRQIMNEVASSIDEFAGATYEAMGLSGVRLVNTSAAVRSDAAE